MHAADEDNFDMVNTLIEAGAKIDIQDSHGWTASMFAFSKGHVKSLIALLNKGADIYLEDIDGKSLATFMLADKNIPSRIKEDITQRKKFKLKVEL